MRPLRYLIALAFAVVVSVVIWVLVLAPIVLSLVHPRTN